MDVDQKMAARLRAARFAAGFKNAKAACRAHRMTYPTYAGHENGYRGFVDDATHYADIFDVGLEWLLTGYGDMRPHGSGDRAKAHGLIDAAPPDALPHIIGLLDALTRRK